MTKIENDGTQQTQQYSKEVQPINNDNSNTNSGQTSGNIQTITNNIYPNSGQATTKTHISDSEVKSTVDTVAGTAISAATGLGAGETAGIAAGVTTVILALGGGIFNRKKLNQAFKNTFSGKKSGGKATSSRLLQEEGNYVRGTNPGVITDLHTAPKVKGTKAGKYDTLTEESNPLQADFEMRTKDSTQTKADKIRQLTQEKLDRIREQAKLNEQKRSSTTPKPSPRATAAAKPQATPKPSLEATALNILLHPSQRYMEPTTFLSPGEAVGVTRARTSGI
jgi:hypothetical protein